MCYSNYATAMGINEPGQDRNVAALSILFMCDGFLNMDKQIKFMKAALKEAEKARESDEVPIGCVIVKDNKIIARAHNLRESSNLVMAHAEMLAISKANKKLKSWRLDGCDIYVTLEPCIMCAGALIQSRIAHIYYGAKDFKGGGLGSSIDVTKANNINHHPIVIGGILESECSEIISNYFRLKR